MHSIHVQMERNKDLSKIQRNNLLLLHKCNFSDLFQWLWFVIPVAQAFLYWFLKHFQLLQLSTQFWQKDTDPSKAIKVDKRCPRKVLDTDWRASANFPPPNSCYPVKVTISSSSTFIGITQCDEFVSFGMIFRKGEIPVSWTAGEILLNVTKHASQGNPGTSSNNSILVKRKKEGEIVTYIHIGRERERSENARVAWK